MVNATESDTLNKTESAPGASRLQFSVRLQPTNHSDQPVFSNFTMVLGTPTAVFLDFGFLDPGVPPALARAVQAGGQLPERIDGRLACRVVLGVDAAVQLTQQLEQFLRNVQARPHQAHGNGAAEPSR